MTTITLFTHEFPPIIIGGVGNTARILTNELVNRGFKVRVVTLKFGEYSKWDRTETSRNLKIWRLQLPSHERLIFSLYTGFFSYRNKKIMEDSDLIHSLDPRDTPFIRKNKPLIVNANDYIAASTPLNPFKFPWPAHDIKRRYLYYNFTKPFKYIGFRRADMVIPNSRYTADVISNFYKIPERKIRVVHKGIDISEFGPEAKGEDIILFVGGNLQGKGVEELLYASRIILKKHKNMKVVIIGNINNVKYTEYLQGLANKLGIKKSVKFLYNLDHSEVVGYYLKSRIFALPSYREGLCQAVIEAMAAKLPVVATKVGGIPEVVEEGKTGFLVKLYSVKELASRIEFLLENPEIAKRMGIRGYKKACKEFSSDRMVKGYIKIYDSLIKK